MRQSAEISDKVSWKSPSNIALVKYWGKKGGQIPRNPSLSLTLSESYTRTTVDYSFHPDHAFSFALNNITDSEDPFYRRLVKYFEIIHSYLPYLKHTKLHIKTHNTFPHSAGIASSASGFSALAFCLYSINEKIAGTKTKNFLKDVSYLSRLGSGSACRSVYGGLNLWGKTDFMPGSTDEYAIPLNNMVHPSFLTLRDAIILTDPSPKPVSSSKGHELMNNHIYAESRYKQAVKNLKHMLEILKSGDLDGFVRIVENEALSLHALMMTSEQSYLLLNDKAINIIKAVQAYRKKTGTVLAFTLDAGPNVHLLYTDQDKKNVTDFIKSDVLKYTENGHWRDDYIGMGPERIF